MKELYHAGEDWFASPNTPINAVADGVVRYSSKKNDKGIHQGTTTYKGGVVIIEHTLPSGGKIYSMYAHVNPDKILVSDGEKVKKGQTIAEELYDWGGNTHLHWEMRHFFDASGICSGIPGPGYTYPERPDNFVFDGEPYSWTNPSAFVRNHQGKNQGKNQGGGGQEGGGTDTPKPTPKPTPTPPPSENPSQNPTPQDPGSGSTPPANPGAEGGGPTGGTTPPPDTGGGTPSENPSQNPPPQDTGGTTPPSDTGGGTTDPGGSTGGVG
jgi:murein DD-endopeptidase MepM/ murein hydrolase activator NlpD